MTLKNVFQLSLFLIFSQGFAQVGIGTTAPNASTQLEVVSSNKGVLIPQVGLSSDTDTTTIANGNVESLLIYNTSSTAGLSPGYYYWSNTKWNRLAVAADISESLSVEDNLTSTSSASALSAN